MTHKLIYKQTAARPCGVAALMGWTAYEGGSVFRRRDRVDQISDLAIVATSQAIECGHSIAIAWGEADPTAMPVNLLEEYSLSLRPLTLFCPEQPRRPDTWIVSNMYGAPGRLPVTAVQAQLTRTVETLFPRWMLRGGIRPDDWSATAIVVRHDVNALDLGLVELAQLTPDDRLGHVAKDPEVKSALRASDPAKPETMAALVRARLDAQARAGVALADRAPLYSSEVESLLMPVVFPMSRGDGPGALATLRRDLRRQYLDMGEVVLAHALRVFPHENPGIQALREAAWEMTAAAAA